MFDLQRPRDDSSEVRYPEHLDIGLGPVDVVTREGEVNTFRICIEQRRQFTSKHTRSLDVSL